MSYRVLHLIGGGEIGGAELHILRLFESFDRAQVSPYLICLAKNSPLAVRAAAAGHPALVYPMAFFMDLRPISRIVAFCRREGIDLIHSHGARGNLLGRLAAERLNIPCISTIHSDVRHDYTSKIKGRLALFVDDRTISRSAGLITVSRSLYESTLPRLQKPLPLTVIYNGIPTIDFSGAAALRRRYRELWQIDDDAVALGSIGRLHPVKSQSTLIEAALSLQRAGKKIHLLIIGEGPLHNMLQSELAASGLVYTLPGYLPDAWQALPAMDLFALPSLKEGMGLVLLEAAQAMVPIVATRAGGVPELFPRQEAILTPPGDSLSFAAACSVLLDDPELCKRQTRKAAERAKYFTLDKMAAATYHFYERILTFTQNK
ncbi:MAG: glycosyltransferase [Gracilibacteraceae bacterium]|jgi:glycosyltransferase involved in cell wall biosynthesis|nr:glycosyltransferase [Gracilibacteraceae bacterium]